MAAKKGGLGKGLDSLLVNKVNADHSSDSTIVKEKFADVIATKNKGQIMKTIMPELKGKADGKVINEVVTEMCNA